MCNNMLAARDGKAFLILMNLNSTTTRVQLSGHEKLKVLEHS